MSDDKLIYYTDGLCGWCFGFSPVMTNISEYFNAQLSIDVISGGLFLGERTGKVNQIAPYIKQGAYKQVERTTGVKFGHGFLDDINGDERISLNSMPMAQALCIVKEQYPDKVLPFLKQLLDAVYIDGMNSDDA